MLQISRNIIIYSFRKLTIILKQFCLLWILRAIDIIKNIRIFIMPFFKSFKVIPFNYSLKMEINKTQTFVKNLLLVSFDVSVKLVTIFKTNNPAWPIANTKSVLSNVCLIVFGKFAQTKRIEVEKLKVILAKNDYPAEIIRKETEKFLKNRMNKNTEAP